jgi:chromate transporter
MPPVDRREFGFRSDPRNRRPGDNEWPLVVRAAFSCDFDYDTRMQTATEEMSPASDQASYSIWDLVTYFVRLGTFGFGGPVALVGYMHRDLVERRGWISESEYKEGMTLAQLMPGPLAAQLAIYMGYAHYSVVGATLVGVAFVLPSFLMVLALGWAYVQYGGISWVQAVFYGVGPCVIGIIAISAYKLTRKTIGSDWLLWLIYLVSAAITMVTESEWIAVFLAAGVLTWAIRTWPAPKAPALSLIPFGFIPIVTTAANSETLWQIAWFFTKAGAFVFGSGLAIIPFLYSGVVTEFGWLNDQQFMDAVAVAMITPGPVVITVGFIGYIVAGVPGAIVAAVATFLPCYLLTILPAPYFRKHGKRRGIVAFVDGVTAAAIGAISGAVIVLGRRTIVDDGAVDVGKVVIAVVTVAVLWRFKKLPEPALVAVAAVAGLLLY